MADWQFTLNVEDIWEKSSKETAETDYVPAWFIVEPLKRLKVIHEEIKKSSEMKIRSMADTPLDNKFGGKKMCWIKTRI